VAIRANSGVRSLSEHPWAGTRPIEQQLRSLIRYAILAPSTRNSQPWRFTIAGNTVRLWADQARRLPVADPDGRELHLSLGCALENLLVAAAWVGFRHEVACFPDPGDPDLAAIIAFHSASRTATSPPPIATLETLQQRRTSHRPFIARQITPRIFDRLRSVSGEPGIRVSLCDDADRRRVAEVLSVRAVATLFGDEAYRREIAATIGGGGSWLTSQAGRLTMSHFEPGRRLAQQISAVIRSAPVIGVIGSMADAPLDQLRSGRVLERLWLAAAAEGLAMQPIGYALEAPATRAALSALFPEAGSRAQELVRLGYSAARDGAATPRRPVEDVISACEDGRAANPA
jgi:nitroreductase